MVRYTACPYLFMSVRPPVRVFVSRSVPPRPSINRFVSPFKNHISVCLRVSLNVLLFMYVYVCYYVPLQNNSRINVEVATTCLKIDHNIK